MNTEYLLNLLEIGVTLRTMRQVGSQKFAYFFSNFLTIHAYLLFTFDICFLWNNYNNPDVELMMILFSAIALVGVGQITMKNFASIPYYNTYVSLIEWIKDLYNKKSDNDLINNIFQDELKKAYKNSITFYKAYSIMFNVSGILLLYNFLRRPGNNFHIHIPGLPVEDYKLVYRILQYSIYIMDPQWNVLVDTAIVIIGFYIMAFINSINKMIEKLNDPDIKTTCPDLLMRILEKHNEMVEQLYAFNECLYLISFIQFVMSTIMYLTMFFTVRNGMDLVVNSSLVCVLFQLFMLCAFGELISSKTEKTMTLLYLTNWYEMSLSDQKAILIMLAVSQKSLGLKAAGMYDVNVMAFIQIVKVAMSYSALIYTLK